MVNITERPCFGWGGGRGGARRRGREGKGVGGRVQLACLGIGCRNDPLTSSRNLP